MAGPEACELNHAPTSDCPIGACYGANRGSAARDEGDDDVCGVPVEVLASAVVDRCGARVGMPGGECTSRNGTPASSAAMMNAAHSMCGCTAPSPARVPIDRT